MKINYIVDLNEYKTLKDVLKKHFNISNRLITKLKINNKIQVNNICVPINFVINDNDIITIDFSFQEKSENIIPKKMELDILYEDDSIIVVNKPANVPVHPSMNHFEDSLSNGIQYYYDKKNIETKIRPVTRLDKDTSGIVVFAKNEYVQESLIMQMKSNTFKKYYLAILEGNLTSESGTINAPISRKTESIIEREINQNGQNAITHYKLIKNYNDYCLVEFLLETGRTHQIRVHSKYIGHSILGDSLYGTSSSLIKRQALHCYKISFIHPILNSEVNLTSKLPNDMSELI